MVNHTWSSILIFLRHSDNDLPPTFQLSRELATPNPTLINVQDIQCVLFCVNTQFSVNPFTPNPSCVISYYVFFFFFWYNVLSFFFFGERYNVLLSYNEDVVAKILHSEHRLYGTLAFKCFLIFYFMLPPHIFI